MDTREWFQKKLKEIREKPHLHRHHDLNALHACCMSPEGALDLALVEAHKNTVPQRNPGG
jgi:hypothetical protein